jgi:hypothetical protein
MLPNVLIIFITLMYPSGEARIYSESKKG